jgi:hypothetical protein
MSRRVGINLDVVATALIAATAGALVDALLTPPNRWLVLALVVGVVLLVIGRIG